MAARADGTVEALDCLGNQYRRVPDDSALIVTTKIPTAADYEINLDHDWVDLMISSKGFVMKGSSGHLLADPSAAFLIFNLCGLLV